MDSSAVDDAEAATPSVLLRLAARVLDVALVAYVFGVIVIEIRGRLLGGDVFATRPLAGAQDPQELLFILGLVVAATDTIPMAIWGRSVGKAMLGMKAVRSDDPSRAPGLARALMRTMLVFGFVLLPPVVGGLLILALLASLVVDPRRRALHDRLAGTVVVSALRAERPDSIGRGDPTIALPPARPPHPDDL